MSTSTYIHGTSPEEQRRLSLMNDVLLNPLSLRELALRGDERIIDFGAGHRGDREAEEKDDELDSTRGHPSPRLRRCHLRAA